MKLCSACLLGAKCRYDGACKPNQKILDMAKTEILIPICPEQLGGRPTPRGGVEIKGGEIFDINGNNFTAEFESGAAEVLRLAKLFNISEAILKQRSPSCGCGQIFDGSFSGKIIPGDGITTRLLKENGIKVISEEDIEKEQK